MIRGQDRRGRWRMLLTEHERREREREKQRRFRENNPTAYRAIKKRAWAKLRNQAIEFLGGCCTDCGNDDPLVLQLDHKHGDGWRDRGVDHHRDGPAVAMSEPERFELRCANCHIKKTRVNGEYWHADKRDGKKPIHISNPQLDLF